VQLQQQLQQQLPYKSNAILVAEKRLLLVDATIVVQNAVASASVASSPTPFFSISCYHS
jgi:hypothetical protein